MLHIQEHFSDEIQQYWPQEPTATVENKQHSRHLYQHTQALLAFHALSLASSEMRTPITSSATPHTTHHSSPCANQSSLNIQVKPIPSRSLPR